MSRRLLVAVCSIVASFAFADVAVAAPSVELVSKGVQEYIDEGIVLQNGSGVLFDTKDPLVAADTDAQGDVYLYANGSLTFMTPGLAESVDLPLVGATYDGSTFYVETTGQLKPIDDHDGSGTDVYAITAGNATLVSTTESDGQDNGGNASFAGASNDGSIVFFSSTHQFDPSDVDGGAEDIYSYRPAGIAPKGAIVSTSTLNPQTMLDVSFCGASDDGSVVSMRTDLAMLGGDADGGASDIYVRSGGNTLWASTGPDDADGPGDVSCGEVSPDGSTVAFTSRAQLFAADDTNQDDVYTFSGGVTHWISKSSLSPSSPNHANYAGISTDGSKVFFNTPTALSADDTDGTDPDGYSVTNSGEPVLLTGGSLAANESGSEIFVVSRDSTTIVFGTVDPYVATDTDEEESDLYAKVDGGPALHVSTGPADDHGPTNATIFHWRQPNRKYSISATGERIGFYTAESLTADDTDSEYDVFEFINLRPGVTPPPPLADTAAPTISSAKLSNKTFAIDKKVKALTVAKTKKGAKISFSLSEAATVKLAFSSVGKGRKSGSKCVKETSKNKSGKKCDLLKLVRTGKHNGTAGANSIAFGGKVGSKTLSTGSYQLKITATDAAGNATTAKSLSFKIVK